MSIAPLMFNISRAGKVMHENLSVAQVIEGVSLKAILPSDHYWTAGMTDWALVSSRQWAVIPAPAPAPSPVPEVVAKPIPQAIPALVPVSTSGPAATKPAAVTPSVQSRPAIALTKPPTATPTPPPRQPTASAVVDPIEKGFSPYVTYYRSNDDRWVFGIFGGLAHRNVWPKPLLFLVRLLMLIMVFPGLAYLGWGFTAMLLTPSLPTAKIRSYYDLNNGLPSQDATDFNRLLKILVVGFIAIVVVGWLVSRRF